MSRHFTSRRTTAMDSSNSQIINIYKSQLVLKILIFCLYCLALTSVAAPYSSQGPVTYIYNYQAEVSSSNSTGGFKFSSQINYEILTELSTKSNETDGWLIRLGLTKAVFHELTRDRSRSNEKSLHIPGKYKHMFEPDHMLYAHIAIDRSNGSAQIRSLYSHSADASIYKNLKKSILLNLIQHKYEMMPLVDDNRQSQPELFSPDLISNISIKTELYKSNQPKEKAMTTTRTIASNQNVANKKLTIHKFVEGSQNVTFKSRVFSQASSDVRTNFKLNMIDVVKSKNNAIYDKIKSIDDAIILLINQEESKHFYEADSIGLQREAQVCTNHHCKQTLHQLYEYYRESLEADQMASVGGSVAYLRLLDLMRLAKEAKPSDMMVILKKLKGNTGAQAAFLDILAAARTVNSIESALKYLKLHNNNNLDIAERFLTVLSVSAKTGAKMRLNRHLKTPYQGNLQPLLKLSAKARTQKSQPASSKFIISRLIHILDKNPSKKWRSQKLRWSTMLTIGTLLNAHHQEHNYANTEDELTRKFSTLVLDELDRCHEFDMVTECRIVMIQTIGNVAHLSDKHFSILTKLILGDEQRESIAAMKVLRDLLAHRHKDKHFAHYLKLRDLLIRVVYDHTRETTSRVLAAELIVKHLQNSTNATRQLLDHLPFFANRELATMIYSRMASLMSNDEQVLQLNRNWFWKSCITNGTSASFLRQIAKTDALNASYGVNIELLNGQKILKESSFDLILDTNQRSEDLFSLGLFTRGLTNIPLLKGNKHSRRYNSKDHALQWFKDNDSAENSDDNLMAGMNLKLLGGYLRPYIFFSSYFELGKHLFWGTAKEPMVAFSGNLLLIDYEEAYPLISGFVSEQQMRGVLSIEVIGKADASLMSGSHSVVRTRAATIVQASQSIFTGYETFWLSNLYSFGGEALIDFVADASWISKPYQMCLQVTQPQFLIRRDQMFVEQMRRKLKRQNYHIGAKSYSLNNENNKMCTSMLDNDKLVEHDSLDM